AAWRYGGIEPARLMGMEHHGIAIVASRAPKSLGLKPDGALIHIKRRGHAFVVRHGPQGDAPIPRKRNRPESSRELGPGSEGESKAVCADEGRRPGTAAVIGLKNAAAGATVRREVGLAGRAQQ